MSDNMELFAALLLFCLAVALIVKGGDFFVDAAVWIAHIFRIPKVIVGATVVSLATTLPEIIVSVIAAAQGKDAIAVGNAVGSITSNLGLIFGIAALCMPFCLRRADYFEKGVLMLCSVATLYVCSLSGSLSALGIALLLILFALFCLENIGAARNCREPAPRERPRKDALIKNILKFALGSAGIVWGADLLVENGGLIAEKLGVSQEVISVTLIAVGTSLPELVTTVAAIVKKQCALSIGNIIGANIIDATLILPLCTLAAGKPLRLSQQSLTYDLPFCLAIGAVAVVPMLVRAKLTRWQGAVMLILYALYLVLVVSLH